MSPEASDALTATAGSPASQRAHNRLRLAVVDRDPGFMQVLANRLDALGWDLRALSSAVTVDALVGDAAERAGGRSRGARARAAGSTSSASARVCPGSR